MGTMQHWIVGKSEIVDEKYGYKAIYEMGTGGWGYAQDFLTGAIFDKNETKICDIRGSYMGFMDIGGKRYFDAREI